MFTYKITKTEKINIDFANYEFDLFLDNEYISSNKIYNIKISKKDKVFNDLTINLKIK